MPAELTFYKQVELQIVVDQLQGAAMGLTDLNAAQIRIRDSRSRVYFAEALKSFNAGALRAAIAATWVAVAFDLIRKYRELAGGGDAEATTYIASWDTAIEHNNTSKLLELERELLTHAHSKMSLIDAMGLRSLQQLQADRHLCAHPSFSTQEYLFEPIEEVVRAHMAHAVDHVLAQAPIQGRGIFEVFSVDIQAPGFPSDPHSVANYVEQKYLARMRPNIVTNFGTVLAKSIIRNVPADWNPFKNKVLNSLIAVQRRRPERWPTVSQQLVNLINEDRPADRRHFFSALATFPELIPHVQDSVFTAMDHVVVDTPDLSVVPEVFYGLELERFREPLIHRLAAMDTEVASHVFQQSPHLSLWPDALRRYSEAGSYRWAEAYFTSCISPFASVVGIDQLSGLFRVVGSNGQIWNASGTPSHLISVLNARPGLRPDNDALFDLYKNRSVRRNDSFTPVWEILESRGWVKPTAEEISARDAAEEAAMVEANQ